MHRVLVLLSTYNGERFVKEQLDSLLAQIGVDVTVMVRDDGSKDQTCAILKEYSAKHSNIIVDFASNVGCANSFGNLLLSAHDKINEFDYFAFSDQDDVWLPEKLSKACSFLVGKPNDKPLLYCSNLNVVDQNLSKIGLKWTGNAYPTKGQSLVCSKATGCTMVFNPCVVDTFFNYQPRSMVLHDLWVFHLCMFLGEVVYDNDSYILYRQHGGNVVGAKLTFKAKIKSKYNSFLTLKSQHDNELEAKELLRCYGSILPENDKKLISVVANYRNSLTNRLRFLFRIGDAKGIDRLVDNHVLNYRIILGCV